MNKINESVIIPYTRNWRHSLNVHMMRAGMDNESFVQTLIDDVSANIKEIQESGNDEAFSRRELERYFRHIAMMARRSLDPGILNKVLEGISKAEGYEDWIGELFTHSMHMNM